MTDSAPSILSAQPWYTSAVQKSQVTAALSALLALSPKVGSLLGLHTPADVQAAVEAVFGVIALIAPVIGSIYRAHSTVQPLTLTQKAADAHPTNLTASAPIYQPPKDTPK